MNRREALRTQRAAYHRQRYATLREHGLCVRCKQPAQRREGAVLVVSTVQQPAPQWRTASAEGVGVSDSFKVQVADEYGTLVVSKGNEYVCEMVGQYKDNAELAHKFAAATEMYGTLTFLESYFTLASNEDARGVVAKVLAKARGE